MMMIDLMIFIPMTPTITYKTQNSFNTMSEKSLKTNNTMSEKSIKTKKQTNKQKPDPMKRLTGLAEAKAAKQATARRAKAV